MSWREMPLGEAIRLKRGHDLPASQRVLGEVPVISSSGVTGHHNIAKVIGPGVITGRYGTLGEVHYIEGDYWPLNTALYVEDFKGNYPRFIAYLLSTLELGNQNAAGAVPGVNRNTLHQMAVCLPDVKIQLKIAGILSAYDDLIAINQRRIQLLEKAARCLYREWFVHLRFPGYEFVPVKDGVPEGWMKGTAFDFLSILSGGTPKTGMEHYWNGEIPFFTPKDCTETFYVMQTEKMVTESGVASCNSRLFPKETIFITARGTVGKIALAQKPMAMNQSCYALVPKHKFDNLFLFLAIKEAVEHVKQVASGGVFSAIVVDTFKVIPFVLPTLQLTDDFGKVVRPFFDQIETLIRQNVELKKARDLLLPKLMSGQIDVSRIPLPGEMMA